MKIVSLLLIMLVAALIQAQSKDLLTTQASSLLGQKPMAFMENKGQVWDADQRPAPDVKYHLSRDNMNIFMLSTGIAYQFTQIHFPEGFKHNKKHLTDEEQQEQKTLEDQIRVETYRMDMELVGANPKPTILREKQSQDYINYYNRNILNVHSFEKLTYKDIYPGIDWVVYTTDQGLKYDFVLAPHANPHQIKLRFKDHEKLKLNKDGSFTLSNRMGSITEQAPVSFQNNKRITTAFQLQENTITFQVENYDATQTLIIDPNLIWATYYGSSDSDLGNACVTDASGNVYLLGSAFYFNSNIASGGHQNTHGGGISDAFLVKFNSAGVRQWATYYGGSENDFGYDCAVDGNGNIYFVGTTESSNNIASGGFQNSYGGVNTSTHDAYLVKMNSAGVRQWATYYGGGSRENGYGCAVDANGNVYLSGSTLTIYTNTVSTNIASGGHQNSPGGGSTAYADAFLVKFNTNGARQWGTYYGGALTDIGSDCVVDGAGNVYMAGTTGSSANIGFGGHQSSISQRPNGIPTEDAYLVKFNSAGVRQWGTYYGGFDNDFGYACAVDGNDNVFLVGEANSTSRIASGGHQGTIAGGIDVFLAKFNSAGVRQWGTYYGGTSDDYINGVAADVSGNVYLCGSTESTNGIASGGHQNTFGGIKDAYLVRFFSSGIRAWGTYYGGTRDDGAAHCTVDPNGDVYLCGTTKSSSGIALGGHQNTASSSQEEAFLAKFQGGLCVNATGVDVQTVCGSFTWIDGNIYLTNNNTATHTILGGAANGCDSTVTLNLTVISGDYNISSIPYTAHSSTAWNNVSLNDDEYSSVFPIGFNFDFFGVTYSDFKISSNGFITFDLTNPDMGCCSGEVIPDASWPDDLIALFWEDLDPSAGGSIRYVTTGTAPNRKLIVEFLNVPHRSRANPATGQMHLYEGSNVIEIYVLSQPLNTGNHTLGIENWSGTIGYSPTGRNGVPWTASSEGWRFAPLTATTGVDVQTACGSFTWIDGNTYTNSNNTATYTITNGAAGGCDSTITLNLTITPAATGVDVQTSCGAYTWIDGNTYTSSNNTATYTIAGGASNGCDSIVTLDLTIAGVGNYTVSSIPYASFTSNGWNNVALGDDDLSSALPIGFNFNFFGNNYSSFKISSNGFISFGTNTSNGCCIGQTLPNSTAANNLVALFWEDLAPNLGGSIRYLTRGTAPNRELIVEFLNVPHYGGGNNVSGQVRLNEATNVIEVYVANQPDNSGRHTLGIENASGTVGYSPTNRNGVPWIATNEAWRFAPQTAATGVDVQTACSPYTWIDGNSYTSNNTTATYTITGGASNGCDSIVTLNLTITTPPTGIDIQTSCSAYTWIDGNTYTSSNNTATYTITGGAASGCDSIVTLNLTINAAATGVDIQTSCGAYTWIDGNIYTSSNNTATYTIVGGAVGGCDSTVALDLTIFAGGYTISNIPYNNFNAASWTNVTLGDDAVSSNLPIGFSFDFFDNSYVNFKISSNGFISFGNNNLSGCCAGEVLPDATLGPNNLIALFWEDLAPNLGGTIRYVTTGVAPNRRLVVEFLNVPHFGGGDNVTGQIHLYEGTNVIQIYVASQPATSGRHTLGIENATGTAGHSPVGRNGVPWTATNEGWRFEPTSTTRSVDVQVACGSYTWPLNGNTYTSSNNTASVTLTNSNGCDSIVTLDLTINNGTTGVDVQMACGSYTWIDGNTYTSNNNSATITLTNAGGCDSIVTLNLTITTVDVSTMVNGNIIIANATNANYQWLYCDSSNRAVQGATSASFTPPVNGNYAVVVNQNGCVDTSNCVNVAVIGLDQLPTKATIIKVYPNPTNGLFAIDLQDLPAATVLIYAANGQLVGQEQLEGSGVHHLSLEGAAGLYLLQIQIGEQIQYSKLIKE